MPMRKNLAPRLQKPTQKGRTEHRLQNCRLAWLYISISNKPCSVITRLLIFYRPVTDFEFKFPSFCLYNFGLQKLLLKKQGRLTKQSLNNKGCALCCTPVSYSVALQQRCKEKSKFSSVPNFALLILFLFHIILNTFPKLSVFVSTLSA